MKKKKRIIQQWITAAMPTRWEISRRPNILVTCNSILNRRYVLLLQSKYRWINLIQFWYCTCVANFGISFMFFLRTEQDSLDLVEELILVSNGSCLYYVPMLPVNHRDWITILFFDRFYTHNNTIILLPVLQIKKYYEIKNKVK